MRQEACEQRVKTVHHGKESEHTCCQACSSCSTQFCPSNGLDTRGAICCRVPKHCHADDQSSQDQQYQCHSRCIKILSRHKCWAACGRFGFELKHYFMLQQFVKDKLFAHKILDTSNADQAHYCRNNADDRLALRDPLVAICCCHKKSHSNPELEELVCKAKCNGQPFLEAEVPVGLQTRTPSCLFAQPKVTSGR